MAEVKLTRTGTRGDVTVAADLGPKGEHTALFITDPQGSTRPFRPIARLCTGHGGPDAHVTLTEAEPTLYANAFLGYGSDGVYFSTPGLYKITAAYHAHDGATVVSRPRPVWVRSPLTRADQEVGELMFGDQQGTLLALLGSDAPQLRDGTAALAEVADKHSGHPAAAYARLVLGANAGRHFQHVRDGRVRIRQPDLKTSVTQLSAAIDASRGDAGLDNLTLNAAMRRLATVHAKAGDTRHAGDVLDRMEAHFRGKRVPGQVQRRIQARPTTRAAASGT